jgi:hypothetical protein
LFRWLEGTRYGHAQPIAEILPSAVSAWITIGQRRPMLLPRAIGSGLFLTVYPTGSITGDIDSDQLVVILDVLAQARADSAIGM